jgi:hypothetical protein
LLQVWSRFAIFGEFHTFSFPKILRKIRQPLDASRHHLTKFQLQKHFPHARNVSSNRFNALFLLIQKSSEDDSGVSRQAAASISPVTSLAPCSLLLLLILIAARSLGRIWASVASCPVNAGVFRDGSAARGGRQKAAPQNGVLRTAQTTSELRVSISLPALAAEPSPRTGVRERALCRR